MPSLIALGKVASTKPPIEAAASRMSGVFLLAHGASRMKSGEQGKGLRLDKAHAARREEQGARRYFFADSRNTSRNAGKERDTTSMICTTADREAGASSSADGCGDGSSSAGSSSAIAEVSFSGG